ncbi:NAD-dependent epimerase/dehydratase family protein [Desulfobacter vibrioformis]|uniref:NAD-dependent epimerase/dehydratase family protein n=1 Tax=Desulfobacter vibrioformis TaxID=34031 RepID=UPI00054F82C0|nr:NAD-dependent epimerase/dehydratase family protein [Desulfobacter vibrioformis]
MNVAVTGGTGCLGRPLIERLIADGAYLNLLALQNDAFLNCQNNKVKAITGDINSPEALDLLCMDCDVVFHLAGRVHSVPRTKEQEEKFFRVNVEGTKNLLEAAKKNRVKKVVFYSTVGVYGKDADFHGDELSTCKPGSVYAESKYQAEQLVLNSSNDGGPEGVVLRFPVVYGPLDRGNVAALIKAVRKKIFFYFGDGNSLRSMISSKNAAEAAIRVAFEAKAVNELFCVTDGRDYTMNEMVDCICGALGMRWRPFHAPVLLADLAGKFGDIFQKWIHVPFPIDSARVRKLSKPLTFSCEKAKRVLGYEPLETLEEGIRREVEWLRAIKKWR